MATGYHRRGSAGADAGGGQRLGLELLPTVGRRSVRPRDGALSRSALSSPTGGLDGGLGRSNCEATSQLPAIPAEAATAEGCLVFCAIRKTLDVKTISRAENLAAEAIQPRAGLRHRRRAEIVPGEPGCHDAGARVPVRWPNLWTPASCVRVRPGARRAGCHQPARRRCACRSVACDCSLCATSAT
jgi:hypothetical protein